MALLDQAKAHFAALERKSHDVPEWGATVWWAPLTIAERRRIYAPEASGKASDGALHCVRAIWLKAQDKNGKALFTQMDEPDLLHRVDSSVVARLGMMILGIAAEPAEDTVESAKNA